MTELFDQGGWVLAAIFALSMLGWSLIVYKLLVLRVEAAGGYGWGEQVIAHLRRGQRDDAMRVAAARSTALSRLTAAALATDEPHRAFFERHIQPSFAAEADELNRHLQLIGVVATLSTLLGLLGTVLGMVVTFRALTANSGGVDAEQLAGGISQALITTQAGLMVALPVVFMHRWLRSRINRHLQAAELLLKKIETIRCHD